MLNTIQSKSEVIRATDECVMCGLCLPHCPTYQATKNESESPRGRIALVRALHEDKLQANNVLMTHLDTCLTCLRCESVCPANVEYENIIDAGREIIQSKHTWLYKAKISMLLLALSNRPVRAAIKTILKFYASTGQISILNYVLNKLSLTIRPLELIFASNKSKIAANTKYKTKSKSKVIIALPCASDMLADTTIDSTKYILGAMGCNIAYINNHCCGALHQHSGKPKQAIRFINKFISLCDRDDCDVIISIATGCGAHIQRIPKLIVNQNTEDVSKKHVDINSFIANHDAFNSLKFTALRKNVFIHLPCSQAHSSHNLGIIEKNLSAIPNIQIKYFQERLGCCGAGGLNSFTQHELANQILENNISELKSKNADYLVTSNIGCALHYQAYLSKEKSNIIVCHPITLLAQQLV